MGISLICMVKNEGSIIRSLFENAKDLVNEFIIVDTGSTDNTLEICEEYKAKIILNPCEPSADMYRYCKQLASDSVSNDWVLNLDADEIISPELNSDIRKFVNQHYFDCMNMRRINFFKNRQYNVDSLIRCFHSKVGYKWERCGCFEQIIPHKDKIFHTGGSIYHFGWYNITEEQLKEKEKLYGTKGLKYFLR